MKETRGKIEYKGREYGLVFNLNVMESIQDEYETVERWSELMYGNGDESEPNAKALKFGFREMLNEAIDIDNEENGTDDKFLTLKQVGRILTEVGLENVASAMLSTVKESTESTEKNA